MFKSPAGPLETDSSDPNHGYGGDMNYEDFEKAALKAGWDKKLKLDRTRGFIGDGAFIQTVDSYKRDDGKLHPGAELTDEYQSEDSDIIGWRDNVDNYKLTPNENKNLNTFVLKYSPNIHKNLDYSTPFDENGSEEGFEFNASPSQVKQWRSNYSDWINSQKKIL